MDYCIRYIINALNVSCVVHSPCKFSRNNYNLKELCYANELRYY